MIWLSQKQRVNSFTDDTLLKYIYLNGKYVFLPIHLYMSDINHPNTYEVCRIVFQFSRQIMHNLLELEIHCAHLLNMDEQYLGSCGTEYQVYEAMTQWWPNIHEADLSDPNLPPDLFLILAFLQSKSLDSNSVMQLSYAFASLSHTQTYTQSSLCRRFSACCFPPC